MDRRQSRYQEGSRARALAVPEPRALLALALIIALLTSLTTGVTLAAKPAPPDPPEYLPEIDHLDPDAALPGAVIGVVGSYFGEPDGSSFVSFQRDNDRTVEGAIVSWTDTYIEVEVPTKAAPGDVTVTVLDEYVSNGVPFTPGEPPAGGEPVIDHLSHEFAPPGTVITVFGSGFTDPPGPDACVEFWATNGEVAGDIISWSDTEIEVEVPGKAIEGFVRVWMDSAWASNGVYFVPADPPASGQSPVVDSLSASAAPQGAVITVYGSYFGDPHPDSFVSFYKGNDTYGAGEVVSWTDTAIEVIVPSWAVPGYVGVVVEDYWVSNGVYFVPQAPPSVTGVTPTSARPGEQVTFTGSGFGSEQGEGYPTFAGTSGEVVSWSDTEVIALVPEGATTGYAGIVQYGLVSNGVYFMPYGSPAISALSHAYGIVGQVITVTGEDFGHTEALLTLAGQPITPLTWSNTEVSFEVPSDAQMGYVGVTRDGLVSNGVWFNPGARISSISDWWGSEGSQLTIVGEGFGQSASDVRVTINGGDAPIVSWSPSEIVIDVPAGATSGYVGVWRDWVCSNGIYYLVIDQANISAVSATTVAPGDEIVISGSDFGASEPQAAVMIGGLFTCDIVSWTDSQIVARIPVGATSGYLGVWKHGVASNGIWLEVVSP